MFASYIVIKFVTHIKAKCLKATTDLAYTTPSAHSLTDDFLPKSNDIGCNKLSESTSEYAPHL